MTRWNLVIYIIRDTLEFKCVLKKTFYNTERNKNVKIYLDDHLGYFECVAKVNDCNFVFTIQREDLLLVDGVNIEELEKYTAK